MEKYAGFYAKSRETCQRIGRSKAVPNGHCIKSCILDKFKDYEKPSVGADARGNPTSDNEGLCQLDMYRIYIKNFAG